ncbi:MAG: hypothetical protein WKF34_07125 [Pyrinomonadaceae bacterium]
MREILEDLQRRKDSRENPCHDCDGAGLYANHVCVSCLGQGVLLTRLEYELLLTYANRADDEILDQQEFD